MFNPEKLSPTARMGVIVFALTAALLSLLARHEYEHSHAVPITLQTAPVDPTSLFQGDYVTLSYDIGRLDAKLFGDESRGILPGSTIYVALKDNGMIWADMNAGFEPFAELKQGERQETRVLEGSPGWQLRNLFEGQIDHQQMHKPEVFAKGRTYYVLQKQIGPVWQPVRASTRPLTAQPGEVILRGTTRYGVPLGSDVRVTYGIESIFVPQGEGHWVERMGWNTKDRNRLLVRVLVSPSGTGYTDNILVDGREAFAGSGLESRGADSAPR